MRGRIIRSIIWATHLQTDILALAAHLDTCPDVQLLIVAADTAPGAAAATAWLERHVPLLDGQAPAWIRQELDAPCSDGAGYRSRRGKGAVQRVAERRCGALDVAAS